ncbi:uncharacterized protein [Triticum aestivum]|uniref:uncharacterized protein n=1 Tax=Triticum aestivum TaxID=4565 RepID=UPI001D02CE18|nr:uncharacterized protein LOC123079973 [Triticum aestivum]
MRVFEEDTMNWYSKKIPPFITLLTSEDIYKKDTTNSIAPCCCNYMYLFHIIIVATNKVIDFNEVHKIIMSPLRCAMKYRRTLSFCLWMHEVMMSGYGSVSSDVLRQFPVSLLAPILLRPIVRHMFIYVFDPRV